jgi:hypothetical protein
MAVVDPLVRDREQLPAQLWLDFGASISTLTDLLEKDAL